jgi:hypothetical protein
MFDFAHNASFSKPCCLFVPGSPGMRILLRSRKDFGISKKVMRFCTKYRKHPFFKGWRIVEKLVVINAYYFDKSNYLHQFC